MQGQDGVDGGRILVAKRDGRFRDSTDGWTMRDHTWWMKILTSDSTK